MGFNEKREWRVIDILSPSLMLDEDAEEFPMTSIPDEKVTLDRLFDILRDREKLMRARGRVGQRVHICIGSERIMCIGFQKRHW